MTSNVRQRKVCCLKEKGEGVWANDVALGEKEGRLKKMRRREREEESPDVKRRRHVFRQ
jgi:hypothetical protein